MSVDSPKDNGIKGFWMEFMNLPGFSESSGEMGATVLSRNWSPASDKDIFGCPRKSLEPLVS
jgi:hypothetical protein